MIAVTLVVSSGDGAGAAKRKVATAKVSSTKRKATAKPTTTTALATSTTAATTTSVGAGATSTTPAQVPVSSKLAWTACEGKFECATVKVPLDYGSIGAATIDIALQRVAAKNPARRSGAVLLNPGGPGGSGIRLVNSAGNGFLSPDAQQRFDVIGFDPRGVGKSTGLPCGNAQSRAARTSNEYVSSIHEACADRAAALTASISTENTARDMEEIRKALGDDKLNYLGISYGTYLGLVYADHFPDRVGRFVIDSAVDPPRRAMVLNIEQLGQYEANLRTVLASCRTGCRFADPDVPGRLARLLDKLDRGPIAFGSTVVNRLTVEVLLYVLPKSSTGLDLLWRLLANLDKGDAGDMQQVTLLLDRGIPNPADLDAEISSDAVYYQVACSEGFHPSASPDYASFAEQARVLAPTFLRIAEAKGRAPACPAWGRSTETRPIPTPKPGSPPMLFVGSLGDEVTPVAWTTAVAKQWPGSVMLNVASYSHGAVLSNTCAGSAMSTFLLDGTLPAVNTVCR